MNDDWRQRIIIDPAIHHGEPCIKGTRVPVSVVVGSIADGDTREQVLEAWPQLADEDIKAALKFAAEAVNNADFLPLYDAGGAPRWTRICLVRSRKCWWPGATTRPQW